MNEVVTKERLLEITNAQFPNQEMSSVEARHVARLALHGLETMLRPIIEAEIGLWYNFYDASGYAYTGEWAAIWRDNVDQWVKPFTHCAAVPKHPSALKGQ